MHSHAPTATTATNASSRTMWSQPLFCRAKIIGLYLVCLGKGKEASYWEPVAFKPACPTPTNFAPLPSNVANVWDLFYKLHKDAFFKDRHYFAKEHLRLCSSLQPASVNSTFASKKRRVVRILDFGCGVGNSIIPLLETTCSSEVQVEYLGLDISPHAVGLLTTRLQAFPDHHLHCMALDLRDANKWNLIMQDFFHTVPNPQHNEGKFDFCLMIFTLSAFEPIDMQPAAKRVGKVLNGVLCFRDYSVGDMAMERFSNAQHVGRNLYQRQDGTLSFFFSPAGLIAMLTGVGMRCDWVKTLHRTIENRATQTVMKRSWLGAEFAN
ncbi:hypothetical protein BASA81_002021 [Batrachochytrium salamandrivorans]|nr:hypothetical protein BASA81_002021 [Batrachochytrium salamandrivorans]